MLRSYISFGHKVFRKVRRRCTISPFPGFSSVPTNDCTDESDDNNETLIYQRNPERNTLAKTSFLASSLNSMYWVWYVVDFIPAVNASAIHDLHIDPKYGFGGLGLSILIQSAFTLYPLSLVSKIAYRKSAFSRSMGERESVQKQPEVLIWKHTLPLLRPSSKPLIFPVGGVMIDKASDNTRIILEELGGNIGNFEGHLGLKRVNGKDKGKGYHSGSLSAHFPLLVDISNPSEVYDSELMLHTLVSGRPTNYDVQNAGRSRKERNRTDRGKSHEQKSKYQKRRRHR